MQCRIPSENVKTISWPESLQVCQFLYLRETDNGAGCQKLSFLHCQETGGGVYPTHSRCFLISHYCWRFSSSVWRFSSFVYWDGYSIGLFCGVESDFKKKEWKVFKVFLRTRRSRHGMQLCVCTFHYVWPLLSRLAPSIPRFFYRWRWSNYLNWLLFTVENIFESIVDVLSIYDISLSGITPNDNVAKTVILLFRFTVNVVLILLIVRNWRNLRTYWQLNNKGKF